MNLICVVIMQLLWTVTRKTFNLVQSFIWFCNGTQSRIKENHKPDAYKGSVQVLDVLTRHKYSVILQPSGADNFLLTHREFVDPEYVLKDCISLYYINKNEAVFIEVEEGIDASQSQYGAFVRFAQYKLAKKLIVMPLSAFHVLGEKVGNTCATVIFLCNTARCGSTLVTQVFEETGSSIAYSEPDAINAVTQLKDVVSETERVRVLKSCMNLLCKPFHSKEIQSYILKINPATMNAMPLIMDVFPECKVVFIYRDGLKCSKSLSKICNEEPLMGLTLALGRLSANLTQRSIQAMGLPAEGYDVKLHSGIHFGAIIWGLAMKLYLEFRKSGMEIVAVRYEDFVDDTTYAYQKLFEYCGLPYDASAVETTMGRDSQRGTPLSLKNLAKYTDDEYTEVDQMYTDGICDQIGVPRFSQTFIAPGTISYRERGAK